MEILLYGAIGYGIGKLYINNVKIVKNQHYTMIKHHIKMFKMNIKTDMIRYVYGANEKTLRDPT